VGSGGVGFEQKIIFNFTPETPIPEAKSSERQKIRVKRRYIAANDDQFFQSKQSSRAEPRV
jgi:hypothetical protein